LPAVEAPPDPADVTAPPTPPVVEVLPAVAAPPPASTPPAPAEVFPAVEFPPSVELPPSEPPQAAANENSRKANTGVKKYDFEFIISVAPLL
jgi:hypothetical protein